MKKSIISLILLLICCTMASAQQYKVMKGDVLVKTYTINQVDSIAIDQVEGIEVFKLMLAGQTVATYNRAQATSIQVCQGVMVTEIRGVPTTLKISVGRIEQLMASVNADASDQTLTWRSSDDTVVMVSQQGHLAALTAGTATITVEANDGSGISASCVVTVVQLQ